MYIKATGNISPQNTFGHPPFLIAPVEFNSLRLSCTEPDYKEIIDVKLIRRMSRIIKMGVAAAMECLKEAAVEMPDAIVTGTAYGCLEDTGIFLSRMVEQKEEMMTPTAFIQSTHNTIGAQIGLMLHCNNYNNTFVHRGFSFESALLDGMLLLREGDANNVLIGAVDELTNASFTILSRLGLYKREPISSNDLYTTKTRGTLAGEGASFFLLASEASATDYARLDGLKTFYQPDGIVEIESRIKSFLDEHALALKDIDLIVTGRNGDVSSDSVFDELFKGMFKGTDNIDYKHLCGEYPTASSFAIWLAANIIKARNLPPALQQREVKADSIRRILVYNHYQHLYHSLFLLSAC